MSGSISLPPSLPAGDLLSPHPVRVLKPNPSSPGPSTSRPPATPPWEQLARDWLSSQTDALRRAPTPAELDAWIDSHLSALPLGLSSLPRPLLHEQILSLHRDPPPPPYSTSLMTIQVGVGESNEGEFPYRFQRTDLWKPVYQWLESMDKDVLISSKEISDWLSANPYVTEKLFSKHSRYHMTHYIQRMHLKMLKKKGKLPKGLQLSAARASVKAPSGVVTTRENTVSSKIASCIMKEKKSVVNKKKEAYLKYELLTDLQNQLEAVLCKKKQTINSMHLPDPNLITQKPEISTNSKQSDTGKSTLFPNTVPRDACQIKGMVSIHVMEVSQPRTSSETKSGQKRKRASPIVAPAWSLCEALPVPETSENDQRSNLHCEGDKDMDVQKCDSDLLSRYPTRKSILVCLQGREQGTSWAAASCQVGYAGKNQERWTPFLEGWRSLEKQFEGAAVHLTRRRYSSWVPTWCAYTSSVAIAQPNGTQGVQKVLDVRFHPEGLPQLVCSSNEAPNELLLYNLLSGKAVQLNGHNCQIHAVEFAARGASVVSCGSNLLKVWDCITGSCLYTLGSTTGNEPSVGHSQKISAMTVNSWQSCLVATSGGKGDGKLLLWNALRGELAADLNANMRKREEFYPSIEVMEFCSENSLISGSDCEYGGPALVQMWDIESQDSCFSFSANDSFITSLKTDSDHKTIITGAGDGSIGIFDIRTCNAINYLSVGSGYEVTSLSFSSCGTYFSASSTSNNTMVWDTRLLPINHGQTHYEMHSAVDDMHYYRPLHCLSHGKQMPTAEHSGQLPGYVDEGDQGVNDAHWLQSEPTLVTVSGDGSIAMWDVTLGQPCIRHIKSHTRCVNTVSVAPNNEYICTGGDDQKVVLYQNKSRSCRQKWRLSHPLANND